MGKRIRVAAPSVVVLLVALAWGFELVLGAVPSWGATFLQFQPWQHAVVEAYRGGSAPLWSPLAGFGSPLAANPQAAAFSPFTLLAIAFGAERGLGLSLLLHAALAGAGGLLAARRLGAPRWPSALAGSLFMLSGALAARAVFPPFFNTAAWLGLAIAAWPIAPRRPADAVLPAIVLALAWLDGHPQAWLLVALSSLIAGYWFAATERVREPSFRSPPTGSGRGRPPPGEGRVSGDQESGSAALSPHLSSPRWGEELEEPSPQSSPIAMGEEVGRFRRLALLTLTPLVAPALALLLAAVQVLPAAELLAHSVRGGGLTAELVAPYDPPLWAMLLLVVPDLLGTPATGDYHGPVGFWEWCWTVGLLALPGVVLGVRRGLPLLLLIVAFGLAFLPGLPGIGPLGRLLAGGDLLRGSGRFLIMADFALALLAAAGLTRYLAMTPAGQRRSVFVTAAIGIGVGVGALAGLALGGGPFVRVGLGLLAAALMLGVVGRLGQLGGPLVVVLIACELLLFSRPLLPLGPPSEPAGSSSGPLLTPEPRFLERFFAAFPLSNYGRLFVMPADARTLPNRGLVNNARDVLAYDPLRLASAERALAAAGADTHALARLGVSEIAGRETLTGTRPPVSWATRAVVASDEQTALARLFDPRLDDDTIVLTGRPPVPPPEGPPADRRTFAVLEARPGRYLTETADDRPGFLRILESNYPGWAAWVDGRPAALVPADGIFIGVPLSAGRHVVVLEYRPWSVTLGAIGSGLAWLSVGVVLARRLAARFRAERPL